MLIDKITGRKANILLYGMTPPKQGYSAEKLQELAVRKIARLRNQPIDGLILYDIQNEAERTDVVRPFPFFATVDAVEYSEQYLTELKVPKIIYRACGKYSAAQLNQFLTHYSAEQYLTVFVGAAASATPTKLSLEQAYEIRRQSGSGMLLGGVTIPERHQAKDDEQQRVIQKMAHGCSFFVSQGVYDLNTAKNFLSDYYYYSQQQEVAMVPIIFTFTPCGSIKTLAFMKWLGISVPRWLENELRHAGDILQKSIEYSLQSWLELSEFARDKGIPIGCNIESVAVRKDEVDASIELLQHIHRTMDVG